MNSKLLTDVEQGELALIRKGKPIDVPIDVVGRQPSFSKAIELSINAAGLQGKAVCTELQIDPAHWSRIMSGTGHFPVDKLCLLMDMTGNEAPLMWLANARGKGLVVLKSEAERRAEAAEAALAESERENKLLRQLVQGRIG